MIFFSKRFFTLLAIALFLFGCAGRQPVQSIPEFTLTPFDSNEYDSAVDNFLIIFDASSSMDDPYNGNNKFIVAREIVKRINQTLPEFNQNAGLRSFGHSPFLSMKLTVLFYGMEPYSTKALDEKLPLITEPGGYSPMYAALTAAGQDLMGVSGKTAVIIISDGQERQGLGSERTLKTLAKCFFCGFLRGNISYNSEIIRIVIIKNPSSPDINVKGAAVFMHMDSLTLKAPCFVDGSLK